MTLHHTENPSIIMSAPPSEPPAGPSTTIPAEKPTTTDGSTSAPADTDGDVKMSEEKPEEVNPYADIPEHVMSGDVETIRLQARLIENEVKVCIFDRGSLDGVSTEKQS